MRVLITSGGTRERIDDVRSIVNHSTGRLGSIIADFFASNGAEVVYVCGEGAALPDAAGVETISIRDVASLIDVLERRLKGRAFDCIIHAMAVSDYTAAQAHPGKISSEGEYFKLILKKTPKVISRIKPIWPNAILVGFKLLAHVAEDVLVQTATDLLVANNCDLVLANDLLDISETWHKGLLVDKSGVLRRLLTKQEIAEAIYDAVLERMVK